MINKILYIFLAMAIAALPLPGQSLGTAGTVQGTVKDPSGAVIAGASVTLENEITNYLRTVTTDKEGHFIFTNIPPNQYHLLAKAEGFQSTHDHVTIRSKVPVELDIAMKLASQKTEVTVHAEGALVENDPTAHNDISHAILDKLPQAGMAAGLSDIITKGTPGVVADANGFFHALGDHAQMSFSVDNEPISDQQGYIFSTQLPSNVIESMETIFGGVPAEYGDKTSLVINAFTRSGLGGGTHGIFTAQYGSFGTVGENFTFSQGNKKVGNFAAVNSIRSGRFLDTPEFLPKHDVGNNINLFDRLDYQPAAKDTLHLNLFFARSWFQIPNTNDQQTSSQDQRQQVISYNIAPGWVRVINSHTVFTLNPYFRQDRVHFYPSADLFTDQPATMTQIRRLTNWGVKSDLAINKGRHNIKTGVQISFTPLQEQFQLGLTDPAYNPVCLTGNGTAVLDPSLHDPGQCSVHGYVANPNFAPGVLAYDLTRDGTYFNFDAKKTIKQQALFFQDAITIRRLILSVGLRFDHYDGLSKATSLQPRLGLSYQLSKVGTVLRGSYTRSLETPFNENLLLSSSTGQGGLAQNAFNAYGSFPLQPGYRNQFNIGLQQGFGRFLVLDGDHFWKFTRNTFDLDTLFGTSVIFPIEWNKSKMDGFSLRLSMPETRGWTAYSLFGHTRARVFGPENGGLIFNAPLLGTVGRIDHDQAFQNTTHIQCQLHKGLPWIAATYRYDSGIVAGAVPDLESLLALTANEQTTIGFYMDGRYATLDTPKREYKGGQWGTRLINIPLSGTQNDDTNPARIKPRHLLDLGVGTNNLFHTEHLRWTLRFTAVNVTNREALYNFLSTCSGTHFVAPRSYRIELGFAF